MTNPTSGTLSAFCQRYRDLAADLTKAVIELRKLRNAHGPDADFGLSADELGAIDLELARFRQADCDPHFRIAVTGAYNTGKSEVINALIGESILPSRGVHTTFIPTVLRWSPDGRQTNTIRYLTDKQIEAILAEYAKTQPGFPTTMAEAAGVSDAQAAHLVDAMRIDTKEAKELRRMLAALRDPSQRRWVAAGDEPKERTTTAEEATQMVVSDNESLEKFVVASVSIDLPAPAEGTGLGQEIELVDLPGNNNSDIWARKITERYVQTADAMVLVITIENNLDSGPNVPLLQSVSQWPGDAGSRLFVVFNKADEFAKSEYANNPKEIERVLSRVPVELRNRIHAGTPKVLAVSAAAALPTSGAHESALAQLPDIGRTGQAIYDSWLDRARDGGGIRAFREQLTTFLRDEALRAKQQAVSAKWEELRNKVIGRVGRRIATAAREAEVAQDVREQVAAALGKLNAVAGDVVTKLRDRTASLANVFDAASLRKLLEATAPHTLTAPTANTRDRPAGTVSERIWATYVAQFRSDVLNWLQTVAAGPFLELESTLLRPLRDRLRRLDAELKTDEFAPLGQWPGEKLRESLDLRLSELLPLQTPELQWSPPNARETYGHAHPDFVDAIDVWRSERLNRIFDQFRRAVPLYAAWHTEQFAARVQDFGKDLAVLASRSPGRLTFLTEQSETPEARQRRESVIRVSGLLQKADAAVAV